MSVQRRDRHLAQLSLTSICYLLLHRVSVRRRDRCTVIVIFCEFLHSHSVSVQRRDRSLFLLLHCSTKVLFYRLAWIRLVTADLFLDFFSRFFIQCVCPKTWQVLCFLFYLTQDLLLHSSAFFWFHSVSVQRRDRCSVTYPTHPFLFPSSLPLFVNLFV